LERIKSVFFLRAGEDSGHKQLDTNILMARAISYERHLTNAGILPEDYDRVYELARRLYVEDGKKGPFGIDEILRGALALKENLKVVQSYTPDEKIQRIDCKECEGTGLDFSKHTDGRLDRIQYETIEGKKKAKHCKNCYGSKN
jgi:hypothetical protein